MGPQRYQKLIRCLACVVAVDLALAVVIIDYRSGAASASTTAAGRTTTSTAPHAVQNGGILGAGTFVHRRGTGLASGTTTTLPAGSALGAPAGSGTAGAGAYTGGAGGGTTVTGGSSSGTGGSAPRTTRTTRPTTSDPTSPAVTTDPGTPAGDPSSFGGDVGVTSTPDPGADVPQTTATTRPPATTTTTAPKKGPSGSPNVVLADKTGDTVIDGTGQPVSAGRADVTKTMVEWTAKAVVLTAQVAQTVDPRQDPNWKSESTYVDWMLDTTGDGAADYEVQYYFDGTNMVADVTKAGGASAGCGTEASYTADGYTTAIDPACLGGASTFTYTATMYYDLDPANPNGNVASDAAPDSGPSALVGKP